MSQSIPPKEQLIQDSIILPQHHILVNSIPHSIRYKHVFNLRSNFTLFGNWTKSTQQRHFSTHKREQKQGHKKETPNGVPEIGRHRSKTNSDKETTSLVDPKEKPTNDK